MKQYLIRIRQEDVIEAFVNEAVYLRRENQIVAYIFRHTKDGGFLVLN